jgi:hypothetical protein
MASSPNRRYLTDYLNDRLNSEIISVIVDPPGGDWDGGWSDDPKQVGSFYQPYTVLVPLSSSDSDGTLADFGSMWNLPYALTSYAVSARSLEDQTDTARRIVSETVREEVDLGGVVWGVMDVRTSSIGGIDINRSVEPSELNQRDVVSIRISRKGR